MEFVENLFDPCTYPCPVKIDRDEGRRDGEVVNEGIQLQHEPELVRGSDKLRGRKCKEIYLAKNIFSLLG